MHVHDVLHGREQPVDAFLPPHHADVADQVAPAVLQRGRRRQHLQAAQIRAAAHDEHLAPASARRARSRCVRYDSLVATHTSAVWNVERSSAQHQAVEQIAALELRLVQLRD